jgi:hypothetical protein
MSTKPKVFSVRNADAGHARHARAARVVPFVTPLRPHGRASKMAVAFARKLGLDPLVLRRSASTRSIDRDNRVTKVPAMRQWRIVGGRGRRTSSSCRQV